MLVYFSLESFYTNNIHLAHNHDPVLPEILKNLKFYPFFKDTLGAIDGTHINCNSKVGDTWFPLRSCDSNVMPIILHKDVAISIGKLF